MKKIKETPKLDTGAVKIYLDDIRSIVEFLREMNPDGILEINIGGYQFTNIDELSELKQKEYQILSLSYKVSSPYTNFDFWVSKSHTNLSYYCSEDSLVVRGTFANIEKFVLSRRRKWQWVDTFFYPTLGFSIPSVIFILEGVTFQEPILTFFGYALFAVTLFALVLFLFTISHRKSQVILVDKADYSSFWSRNKEKILIASISSAITFLLGVLGTLFAQSLNK